MATQDVFRLARWVVVFLVTVAIGASAGPASAQRAAPQPASPVPFTVRVVDSGNRPVAGASVRIVTAAGQALSARTSSDGGATFSVPRGAVKSVDVEASGFLPGHSGAVVVSGPSSVQIALKAKESSLQVTVRDDAGQLVANAEVVVTGASTQARSRSDSRGVATFNLANGSYEVIATAPGYAKVAGVKVEVPRQASATIVFAASPVPFSVKVVDPRNRPVAGASVKIVTAAEREIVGRTGGDGSATFNVPKGAIKSVDVEAPSFLPGHAGAVVVRGPSSVQIALKAKESTVQVTVRDDAGRPVANADVVATGGRTQARSRSDARGMVTFTLPAGVFDVTATAPGYDKPASGRIDVPRQPDFTLAFTASAKPREATLRVKVQDDKGQPLAGVSVKAMGTRFTPSADARTDSQGMATLRLPPDLYTIVAAASGYQQRSTSPVSLKDQDAAISVSMAATGTKGPSNLEVTFVPFSRLHVSFRDNSTDEAGFNIEVKKGSGAWTRWGYLGANVTSMDHSFDRFAPYAPDTTYFFRVHAVGKSDYSNVVSVTTPSCAATPALAAPKLGGGSSVANGATVSGSRAGLWWYWADIEKSAQFEVQVATDPGFTKVTKTFVTSEIKADVEVSRSTTYYWRARARNTCGSSSWSAAWSFRTN